MSQSFKVPVLKDSFTVKPFREQEFESKQEDTASLPEVLLLVVLLGMRPAGPECAGCAVCEKHY